MIATHSKQCSKVNYFMYIAWKRVRRFGALISSFWDFETSDQSGHSLWETKYKIQNLSCFFLVIFGATLSRRFARQIFTSFLSRKDLTKLKKQKNGFLFFVLVTTRYDRARQSQQKLQFCTFFCTPTRNALRSIHMVDVLPIDRLT